MKCLAAVSFPILEDIGAAAEYLEDRPHPRTCLRAGPPTACTPDRMNFDNVALHVLKVVHVATVFFIRIR